MGFIFSVFNYFIKFFTSSFIKHFHNRQIFQSNVSKGCKLDKILYEMITPSFLLTTDHITNSSQK